VANRRPAFDFLPTVIPTPEDERSLRVPTQSEEICFLPSAF